MSNILKTRIRSKIDYLANWNNNSTFIPLLGEICIAIIPRNVSATNAQDISSGVDTSVIGATGQENAPRAGVGLTPYAIGIKVGDGANNFATLPWIQAIAGDVYSWAKGATPPPADSIPATYGNDQTIDTVQEAIDKIRDSLGNIVAGNVDPDTLSSALEALQAQLSGGGAQTLFASNQYIDPEQEGQDPIRQYPTKIIRSIVKDGLTITVNGDNLTADDIPSLSMSKISDLVTTAGYNSSTSPLTSQNYVDSVISELRAQITGSMTFLGIVCERDLPQNTIIEDGTTNVAPIIRTGETTRTISISSLHAGDVILYKKAITTTTIDPETQLETTTVTDANIGQEFVWTGGAWELLGDEGSYAIKGSITNSDIATNANIAQSKISGTGNNLTLADDLNNKVDKETGKGLSTNDYTNTDKNKLAGIENNAEENIIESIKVNGTAQTITNKEVDIEVPTISINGTTQTADNNHNIDISVPVMTVKSHSANSQDETITLTNQTLTLAAIAFDGNVNNLVQTTGDYLLLDCGTASVNISNS